MTKLQQKIQEWKEWCENDGDTMNDHIRDLFNDTLSREELFEILDLLSTQPSQE